MNPAYPPYDFVPQIMPVPWQQVFEQRTPPAVDDLVGGLIKFAPLQRLTPLQCLLHTAFDQLRQKERAETKNLFNFLDQELWPASEQQKKRLVPAWYRAPPP